MHVLYTFRSQVRSYATLYRNIHDCMFVVARIGSIPTDVLLANFKLRL